MMRLIRLTVWVPLLLAAEFGMAQPWEFSPPLEVTQRHGSGIFHHLESSGRRNVAVSAGRIAVAWEDDHDGLPRIYLATKAFASAGFEPEMRVSGPEEAFEPSLVGLPDGRFVIAWEEGGGIHGRVARGARLGAIFHLGHTAAGQANLSVHDNRVYVLHTRSEVRFSRIRMHVLGIDSGLALSSEQDCAVDPAPLEDDQFYPAAAVAGDTLVVAWEDRRPGHTIIMASVAKLDDVCSFNAPVRISERRPGSESGYGKGHGAARVALSGFGESDLMAVWADKRHYWEGYDIYAAAHRGNGRFGANVKVQDEFGDFARQWHASIAGSPGGRLVVAWDDEREGDSDVFLSWFEDGKWSEDQPLPGAAGAGQQSHPSLAVDAAGNLHGAWIERAQGVTRLRYQYGRAREE